MEQYEIMRVPQIDTGVKVYHIIYQNYSKFSIFLYSCNFLAKKAYMGNSKIIHNKNYLC